MPNLFELTQEDNCPICGTLLDNGECHECLYPNAYYEDGYCTICGAILQGDEDTVCAYCDRPTRGDFMGI